MKKLIPLILLITLILTGCTVESHRIYNVCKVTSNGDTYCYDMFGNFYKVYNETVLPISGVGLYPYPTLKILPTSGDYSFEYVLPGNYKGTLTDVNHYVHKLLEQPNAELLLTDADCYIIDFRVVCADNTTRIIYNKSGTVRIYCSDNSGNFLNPLYINK